MATTVYDVYDFKSLQSDNPRHPAIDLTDCAYEDGHRIEIRMTASASKSDVFFIKNFSLFFIQAHFNGQFFFSSFARTKSKRVSSKTT